MSLQISFSLQLFSKDTYSKYNGWDEQMIRG